MFKKGKALFLVAETSVHAGSGTDLGIVDLPIQREAHTGYPKIESSGIKGGIREQFYPKNKNEDDKRRIVRKNFKFQKEEDFNTFLKGLKEEDIYTNIYKDAFGPEPEHGKDEDKAGSLTFTDARILFFPVKSLKGIYAYVTCPDVLNRFEKEMGLVGIDIKDESDKEISIFNLTVSSDKILLTEESSLKINDKVVLEEFAFQVGESKNDVLSKFGKWISDNCIDGKYWKEKIEKDIAVVSNDTFRNLVENYTEVNARIRIKKETGVVADGQLWYEEYLPFDTIMYSLVFASPIFKKDRSEFYKNVPSEEDLLLDFIKEGLPKVINLGGNTTIGKGILRTKLLGGLK